MAEVVRIEVEKPLTLEDIVPPEDWINALNELVITKIYAGGTRLDNGWKYSWDGISRKVPEQIPRKRRGKLIQHMTVMVNMQDRMTIETIFATYTGNITIEYGIFVKE